MTLRLEAVSTRNTTLTAPWSLGACRVTRAPTTPATAQIVPRNVKRLRCCEPGRIAKRRSRAGKLAIILQLLFDVAGEPVPIPGDSTFSRVDQVPNPERKRTPKMDLVRMETVFGRRLRAENGNDGSTCTAM